MFYFPKGESFPQHHAAASLKLLYEREQNQSTNRFPQHHAAASLKLAGWSTTKPRINCFPQHHAAASLKLAMFNGKFYFFSRFSAASCCGLIEAKRIA